MKLFGRAKPGSPEEVWVVWEEGRDAQPILGVFRTQPEARGFVDSHVTLEGEEVCYTSFHVGWSSDGQRYSK